MMLLLTLTIYNRCRSALHENASDV
jgi:hypothetical protein